MKICYVSKGDSVHDLKFLIYLAIKQKYDVHLISFHKKRMKIIPGVTIHQIPMPDPRIVLFFAPLIIPFLIRKIKPDIIQGNYLTTYGFYSAFAKYHPLLQMAWGSDVFIDPKNRFLRVLVKYSLKMADIVSIDCDVGERSLIKLGYPRNRIKSFPWGLNLHVFKPRTNISEVRKKLGWISNPIVICTRSHELVYGIEYLIQAIPLVIKKMPSTRFLFIGKGSLTSVYEKIINKLQVNQYVKFLGYISNNELPEYLSASDLYVTSSLSDGTSVSLMEAMAIGLPIITTQVDALLEWIEDGINGFTVPKKDYKSLALKIVELLNNKRLMKEFGQKNYNIAQEKTNWNENIKNLESIYSLLVKP